MTQEPNLIDYYVGIMRGYLLAKDAPQQVLHALDILLTGYRSRAGGLVLPTSRDIQADLKDLAKAANSPKPKDMPFMETRQSDKYVLPKGEEGKTAVYTPKNVDYDPTKKRYFWSAAEDQIIRDEKAKNTSSRKIAEILGHGRNDTSVNNRVAVLKTLGRWNLAV